jgi:hypothetical protein
VAKKGAVCPIVEGETPLLKKDPKRWPFIDGHSMKAVKEREFIYLKFHQIINTTIQQISSMGVSSTP